ncbi:hypothetical protein EJ110_NYTH55268 [Nymphaea thermarum]|nr:hypothetical protein EJ110_NYTH55268 [Nymphaea thermarum]
MSFFAIKNVNKMSSLCGPMKDALSLCSFSAVQEDSFDSESEELPPTNFDIQHAIISAMRSRATEARQRPKSCSSLSDSLQWVFSPMTGEFTIAPRESHSAALPGPKEDDRREDETEAYFSVKSSFSRCSSIAEVEFKDVGRWWQLINDLGRCEGWPFGLLCPKSVLLPPLPSAPSESWVWRKEEHQLANRKQ